jgi:transcription-repair coupling factor (superfamily II helicase)
MIDRFGLLPLPAKDLFRLAELKLKAAPLGVRKIEAGASGGRIQFAPDTPVDPRRVIALIQQQPKTYKLDGQDRLRFSLDLEDREQRFHAVGALLERLTTAAA